MPTETVDPRYLGVETWPSVAAVEAMIEGQLAAVAALAGQAAAIAAAAEAAAGRLGGGAGRLCYAGAGTSGRIAVLDGVELAPTYGWPAERLAVLMAGGEAALMRSAEGAEDDAAAAEATVAELAIGADDVLIGIAASGTTPYTIAAVAAARAAGALTIAVANNPGAPLLAAADHPILAETGSEIVAGSTRMKAGTAQKATLTILSTTIMIRLGYVHRGRMVNMSISNAKLAQRGAAMVAELADVSEAAAGTALAAAGGSIPVAILVARGLTPDAAAARLATAAGIADALR